MKYHLTRVLQYQPLTFEELSTVTSRVEAILNSRPLYPMSSSPDDYDVLTPGHFTIGDALVSLPQPDWSDHAHHLMTRWQFLQKCTADFWKKWRLEYLTTLQQRPKWQQRTDNLELGTLVVLRDVQAHSLSWQIGRIIEKYPGKDGTVRVVRVKTPIGEYTRPVVRLSPLMPEP
ncbi:uncharacterized protein LOC106665002 [Cimex lectularius]|uniref:DUF5641 domain-containing protein n=1 Tax=Cimex lectularius TaxID=79782 RepID=A0A8I6RJI5_CIMLE|nr:uncharacterized protein LOC106665002 [Cimex lectularius]